MEFSQIFDIIVIGGGPAGYHFANLASQKAFSVALFEEKGLGGTCLNEGCIPTKSFLKSAKIFDNLKHANNYGITATQFSINQNAVVERKNAIVSKLTMGVRGGLRKNKVKLFFTKANVVKKENEFFIIESAEKFYACKNLIIATGSRSRMIDINGIEQARANGNLLTSKEILDIDYIPKKLVVIGGGIVGLEMASYFSTVGTEVTVLESTSKICGAFDGECSKILQENLTNRGIIFKCGYSATKVDENCLEISNGIQTEKIDYEKILLSAGRIANVYGFGLENLDVNFTDKGIIVDENMQTSVKNVYAIGDVNGKVMLAHTAYKEAEICISHIIGEENSIDYANIPSVLYTSPECAWVGLSEEQAENSGLNYIVKKLPMNYSGRFVTENDSDKGICKLIINGDNNLLLGAMMIGDYSSEIILALSNFIALQISVDKINKLIFPHPTVGEIIKDTLNS